MFFPYLRRHKSPKSELCSCFIRPGAHQKIVTCVSLVDNQTTPSSLSLFKGHYVGKNHIESVALHSISSQSK